MNHVFISYRHESNTHAADVRRLAERLKGEGLPVVLDQLFLEENPGGPDEGWVRWCEAQAEKSACVLICCSKGWFDSYYGRGPQGAGCGAAVEAAIFSKAIYDDKGHNARIRLVVLDDFDVNDIPGRLQHWHIFRPLFHDPDFDQMNRWIRQRLAMTSSSASQAGKIFYLAECRYDLKTERTNLCNYLGAAGWQVRPDAEAMRPFEDDLSQSVAFVQLLETYPREDNSHRTQLAQAQLSKVPSFRFRHAKIRLDEVDDAHRVFLTESDVIPGSFDDFKLNLLKELDGLWNQQHAPQPYSARDILVRVAIRATEPDRLWDEVFAWVDAQPGIRPALIEGNESFKEKHDPKVPCHGFLIVCDRAVEEGAVSTKTDLEQCMAIQLGERNEARQPPVGVVFWPPPDEPKWARLLRVSPRKLFRIRANEAGKLADFFQEVRRCAS